LSSNSLLKVNKKHLVFCVERNNEIYNEKVVNTKKLIDTIKTSLQIWLIN